MEMDNRIATRLLLVRDRQPRALEEQSYEDSSLADLLHRACRVRLVRIAFTAWHAPRHERVIRRRA